MKKILISGGAGFIGSNIARKLLEKGYEVTILDNLSEQIHGNAMPEIVKERNINFIRGDVRDKETWRKALLGQEGIIHLAAETGTGQSMYEVSRYTDINIGGTAQLLDLLTNEKHSIEKVIVASSRAIYGEGKYWCPEHGAVYPLERQIEDLDVGSYEPKCPVCGGILTLQATQEDSLIHPTSIYGITKQVQEEMVLLTCKGLGISSLAFRYQNVYGPGQSLVNPYTGILSIFSNCIRTGKKINIFEDGKESRDFVYIDDVAEATIRGLESSATLNCAFNVGSGERTTVLQVVEALGTNLGKSYTAEVTGDYRLGDIRHNYADVSRAKELLGFEAKVKFEEGIKEFTKWVQTQEVFESNYEKSLNEMKNKGLMK